MSEHHHGAFAIVAIVWRQHHEGQWDRRLLRRCSMCQHVDWQPLIYVDTSYMTCMYCLSQDVELDQGSEPLSAVCNDCGARSTLDIDEDDDPGEADEEPEDPGL